MGVFLYPITLIGPAGEATLEALVDTGASYNKAPREVLESLGVSPVRRMAFDVADTREVEYELGRVMVRVNDREEYTLCAFDEPGSESILGAHALEGLGFGVDPVRRILIPVRGRFMSGKS